MKKPLPDIRNLSFSELEGWFKDQGEPRFRAKQVYEWLWKKSVTSFTDMTNISLTLREKLGTSFFLQGLEVADIQKSSDRTIKSAFKLYDGSVE
jgi:23S rRNA (adenine2503-C2)-methyltransferase